MDSNLPLCFQPRFIPPLLLAILLVCSPAWADNASYIDSHNRIVVDGKPFFPIGLYVVQCTDGRYAGQLDEIADSPFDTLINYAVNECGTGASVQQIEGYLDQLQARNLKLIFSLKDYIGHGQKDIDTITHKVNTFKNHPAIISWYMNDELAPERLSELQKRYKVVRDLDPNHPVWSVHWNTNWLVAEAHTTDIVGVDPYPIDNNPITLVSQKADAAQKAGKPLWLVPQIFNWRDYPGDFRAETGRPPTRDEMRAMTYLAINHGARGLIYYSYFNIRDDKDYRTRWLQIKEIASEIDRLRPVLLSTQHFNDSDVICNNSDIDIKLMREGDTYYLFAVNTKKEANTGVRFRNDLADKPSMIIEFQKKILARPEGEIRVRRTDSTSSRISTDNAAQNLFLEVYSVLFENDRQIAVNSGNFTDDFRPYEVHVYQWKCL